jgi:3-oxoacyl-[acyl-carrier-protein] synthase-1
VIYIEGYALISALGKSVEESVNRLRYNPILPQEIEEGIKYYKISDGEALPYYDVIEEVVKEAISHADIAQEEFLNMALFIGTSSAKLPLNEHHAKESGVLLKDLYMSEVSEIIAQRVGIKGFRTIISTACTSSSNALIQAKEMIESGLIQKAIVVGVELYNELTIKGFDSFMLLSKNSMRPFDKERDGIVLGEGLSAVLLGRKKGAFGLVGGAGNVDTNSVTSPHFTNLKEVMAQAIKSANITPKNIYLVKAHATASIQNDITEAQAITLLFNKKTPHILALKPYIGHTMGACGTNELALLLESFKQGFIPKSIPLETIDKACNIGSNQEELEAKEGYYLLNYFGFGGNNSSLVIKYGV